MIFEFFDNRTAFIGLFVQDNRFEIEFFQESRNRFTNGLVAAMDDEDPVRSRLLVDPFHVKC